MCHPPADGPPPHAARRRAVTAALAWALVPRAAQAAGPGGAWPTRPVRIIVPFAPGGLTDVYVRLFAEQLTQQLGATVLVENKTGAGGVIGIDMVAKAPPDGYTLLMTVAGTAMQNRVLYTRLPYDLDKDLLPIAVFPSGSLVVGVAPDVPAGDMKEFLAWAKSRDLTMGTYGPGSYPHMTAGMLRRRYGLKIEVVHYRGESAMWVDVAGGQVQFAAGSLQAFNTVASRGVKPIGVSGVQRSPRLPGVATLQEQGVDDPLVTLEGGLVLMAPAGTPEAILQSLSRVVVKGNHSPQAIKLRENFGTPGMPKDLASTRADWDRVVPAWVKAAAELGIKLD